MGSPRSKPGRSRLVADPFDPKIETIEKGGELSIPGVASPGGAGYDFLRQSIANRLAWRTNGLGAHPGLRHWASGSGPAGAERNLQGKGNVLLFPRGTNIRCDGHVQCRERAKARPRQRRFQSFLKIVFGLDSRSLPDLGDAFRPHRLSSQRPR